MGDVTSVTVNYSAGARINVGNYSSEDVHHSLTYTVQVDGGEDPKDVERWAYDTICETVNGWVQDSVDRISSDHGL